MSDERKDRDRTHRLGFPVKSIRDFTPDYDRIARALGDPNREALDRTAGCQTPPPASR